VRLDPQNVYFRVGYSGNSSSNAMASHEQEPTQARVLSSDNGNGGYFYGMEVDVNASVAYWNWTATARRTVSSARTRTGPGSARSIPQRGRSWLALASTTSPCITALRRGHRALK